MDPPPRILLRARLGATARMPQSDDPTIAVPTTPAASSDAGRPPDSGRFPPGTLIASRFRVVSLLGAGGMGEVYRAEDLRLGQAVALKFLPPALAANPSRRERLHAEVRLG